VWSREKYILPLTTASLGDGQIARGMEQVFPSEKKYSDPQLELCYRRNPKSNEQSNSSDRDNLVRLRVFQLFQQVTRSFLSVSCGLRQARHQPATATGGLQPEPLALQLH
jgi:hypothetical protein